MALMAKYGWLFIVASTLTPLSTKAVSIAAGAAGMPLPLFAAALTLGRGVRFSTVALLMRAGSGAFHHLLIRRSRP
jgi:membrane protein YqaA with SNARE-associated domain